MSEPGFGPETTREDTQQSACRREELSLYLEQLEDVRRSGGDLREAFDGIELDCWEVDQLARGLDGPSSVWPALIAEGVAFRNKYETDIGWLPQDGEVRTADAADVRRLMITDAALGIALLEETQRAVNQLVLVGALDEAKRLTAFRNKIGQSVKDLKGRVDDTGVERAKDASKAMIAPTEEASWTDPDMIAEPAKPRPMRRPAARSRVVFEKPAAAPKNRLIPALALLGVLLAVWAVFILPKLMTETLPTLTLQDVSPRSEIRNVVARPPSLFVELDGRAWSALPRPQRLALVDEVGSAAQEAGYVGAHFALEDGRTAAQWFNEHGSRLTD